MTLTLTADRTLVRAAGGSVRYVLAAFEAPVREGTRPRLPLNLALVIDRSGSMRGGKIAQAREAAAYVVRQLQPQDRFTVVAYDDHIDVLAPSAPATPANVAAALAGIETLDARGTTDLSGGWLSGCREIAAHLDGEQIARCLLLTDGLANRGITDPGVLCTHARELRARGIVTSTFGIGADFDEVRLSALAEAGGGTFRLIRDAEEIPGLVRQELHEGLDVVAPAAVLNVHAPAGVNVTSLNDFPVELQAGVARIRLGDLVAGQVLEPLVRLRFAATDKGAALPVRFALADRDGVLDTREVEIAFEAAGHLANDAQPRNVPVDRRVAALHAARVKREALAFNRDGDFNAARRVIEQCLKRVREYAGTDAELLAIVADLARARETMGRDMEVMTRKAAYAMSVSDVRMRTTTGAARRRARTRSVVVVPSSSASHAAARAAVDALLYQGEDLLGRLRVSERWSRFAADMPTGRTLTPVEENHIVDSAVRTWPDDGARIVLTDARLADNWFSHWHPSGRAAVVSLAGTAEVIGVEPAAWIAYEILLNGLNNASPRYDLLRLAHAETRGCLFDLCADKRDMDVKLQSMHLCSACNASLTAMGIDTDAVAVLTDIVRELARPARRAAG